MPLISEGKDGVESYSDGKTLLYQRSGLIVTKTTLGWNREVAKYSHASEVDETTGRVTRTHSEKK